MSNFQEKPTPQPVHPRIILHGGAGNILRANLPPELWITYRTALLSILHNASTHLAQPGATALDVATQAVSELENNPLFNAGRGAVFTRAGTVELEASVMVSRGYRKRGVGVMGVTRVKNPIKLAKEMLVRGEEEGGGGAQGHCQLTGSVCERLAGRWGLELVGRGYFWTKKRWDEHRKGLENGTNGCTGDDDLSVLHREAMGDDNNGPEGMDAEILEEYMNGPSWNGTDYLPQGTVGCVVLDCTGTLCVATSTGGITNKLPGRVGDTPTLGAGFWAEEWQTPTLPSPPTINPLTSVLSSCLPSLASYLPLAQHEPKSKRPYRSAALGGTGNGDSFLRLAAARTASAIACFRPMTSLQAAVTAMAGPNGMLQRSAEDRWRKTGEGEGGIIGIELDAYGVGRVVADFNCGGMFRAWVDEDGGERVMVFREEY
ncbi:hypothetical protein Q7P37_000935 [Cladosporium fusiforme]